MVNDNEYLDRVKQEVETHNLDFKEKTTNKLGDILAAFANTEGGLIFFGITDKRPRKILGISYEDIEDRVSDALQNMQPRPEIDVKKYHYDDQGTERLVVCVEVQRSDILVQHGGIFHYRPLNSSHNAKLTLDQIRDRISQPVLTQEKFLNWVRTFRDEENEYLYFCIAVPPLRPDVFDFIHQRDLNKIMTTRGEENGLSVSFLNPNFPHPLEEVLKKYNLFRAQESYVTSDFLVVHERRTGNILQYFKNGVVYGRIMYDFTSSDAGTSKKFNPEMISWNPKIYSTMLKNDEIYPEVPEGSFLRIACLIIFLLSYEEFDWLNAGFRLFEIKTVIPLHPETNLVTDGSLFDQRAFLGIEPQILFEDRIWLNPLEIPSGADGSLYQEKILLALEEYVSRWKQRILSYFGYKSNTHFSGTRSDIRKPLYSDQEIGNVYLAKFLEELGNSCFFGRLFQNNRPTISMELLRRLETTQVGKNMKISLFELDENHIPVDLQPWFNQKSVSGVKSLLLKLDFVQEAPPGYHWDEFIDHGVVAYYHDVFTNIIGVILTYLVSHDLDEKFPSLSLTAPQFPSLVDNIAQKISLDQTNLTLLSEEGKTVIQVTSPGELEAFFDAIRPLEPISSTELGMVGGENCKLNFSHDNFHPGDRIREENAYEVITNLKIRSPSFAGFSYDGVICFKCGDLGGGVHLIYSQPNIRVWDQQRKLQLEFVLHLDIPEGSVIALSCDSTQ